MNQEIKQRIEQIRKGEVPKGYMETKLGIIPDNWEVVQIKDILNSVRDNVKVDQNQEYGEIGIKSHCRGIFHKEPVLGKELGNKRVFWVKPNCFVVNIVFAWEQAIGITSEDQVGLIASHRFPMYQPKKDKLILDYLLLFYKTKLGKFQLNLASPGGAGRNKTLGQKEFGKSLIIMPKLKEQTKIREILLLWDKSIELLENLIINKRLLKKFLVENILECKYRFDGFTEEWEEKRILDLLDYEQPTAYLATSIIEYSKELTPVLTANKTMVIGSTKETIGVYSNVPVIIFDDFTINRKYVDFPFKVRSSALKILRPRNEKIVLKFIFEWMGLVKVTLGNHKRHYISEFQHAKIKVPSFAEQKKISNFVASLDREIELLEERCNKVKTQKRGLMQLLLKGMVRVKVD